MKTKLNFRFSSVIFFASAIMFSLSGLKLDAATHVIKFGGSLGETYSPNSLTVATGDTIIWEGDFGFHPLSSTSVPAGAASFHNGTGTVFNYVVTAPGIYNYQCDAHFSFGMTGTFTAILTDVKNNLTSLLPNEFRLYQNYPNPFNPSTLINYQLPFSGTVTIKIYDALGKEVETLVNDRRTAGYYSVEFNAGKLSSGIYIYTISANNPSLGSGQVLTQSKKMLLIK